MAFTGITSQTRGDYHRETGFASARGWNFPPKQDYIELERVVDFDSLAWAPKVLDDGEKYHLYWAQLQLHHVESDDGVTWKDHHNILDKPKLPFFRDAMIFNIAPGQWLLYAAGREKWFSRIDIYHSFDLVHWQYTRPAIRCSWGSEKNFVTGSMESPFLIARGGN